MDIVRIRYWTSYLLVIIAQIRCDFQSWNKFPLDILKFQSPIPGKGCASVVLFGDPAEVHRCKAHSVEPFTSLDTTISHHTRPASSMV
jgi:hypothetical protein